MANANRYKPYIYVVFEDAAYHDIFVGFKSAMSFDARLFHMGDVLGGYTNVESGLIKVDSDIAKMLNRFPKAHVLALIDLDQKLERLEELKSNIPDIFKNRVFIISSLIEAEDAKRETLGQGTLENMGGKLARSCQYDDCSSWRNNMLQHNLTEIERMRIALTWLFEEVDD